MTEQFYVDIENRLKAKLPWFVWFKLFNNQFETMEQRQEQTFPNLSIFMEFISPVPVIGIGAGVQIYDATVRFHLYFITYELQDLSVLTYKREMHKALQGFTPTSSGDLDRVTEQPDQNHNGYMVWMIDYQVQIADEDGSYYSNVIDAAPVELEIEGDLIIDNEIIRTGVLPQ